MKNIFHSSRLKQTLALALTLGLIPLASLAASKTRPAVPQTDTASAYVSAVFDKLQGHWEQQSYESRIAANNLVSFTLNEDGSLNVSHLDSASPSPGNGQTVLAFIQQNAPFGGFPSSLKGTQLEFKVKLTPESLQMLGYQIVEKPEKEALITYASPLASQPVSLFYARALPVTPGKVWDKPATSTAAGSVDQVMNDYVAQVREQVRKNWQLPQDYKFERTSALIMIDRDGSLLSAQLKQSSGDKVVDKAAISAITSAGPFPQAPAKVPSLPVMIEYIFDPVLTPAE